MSLLVLDWRDYIFPGGKFSVFIQTPDSESALSSSRIGSKSLRSVGADVGNAEAVTRPEVGRPEIEAREGISDSASDSSNMTSSFNMVGGVSKILRSVRICDHS